MRRRPNIPTEMSVPVTIPRDEDGFTGRECPQPECVGYFKITIGTALKGEGLPCHCPYCGHIGNHNTFWTKEQLEYARSVALREFGDVVRRELKKMEFKQRIGGPLGIGISLEVKNGPRLPIRNYREKQLETEVVCDQCALRYAIYGVFAWCPDCGAHNSLQILGKNFDLAVKQLELAKQTDDRDWSEHLIADALENVVSAFDGFGREICRIHADKSANPDQAGRLSFQNLGGARDNVQRLFALDLQSGLNAAEWENRGFQKRHLLAHKMGVIDQKYIDATNDPTAVVGRRIAIDAGEVRNLVALTRQMGSALSNGLSSLKKSSPP